MKSIQKIKNWIKNFLPKEEIRAHVNPKIIEKCIELSLKYSRTTKDYDILVIPYLDTCLSQNRWVYMLKYKGIVKKDNSIIHEYKSSNLIEVTQMMRYYQILYGNN